MPKPIDRFTKGNTLTRYRKIVFWDDGIRRERWTTVTVYSRKTGKVIHRRKAGSAVPDHVRNSK
jgi:hypothetical protein